MKNILLPMVAFVMLYINAMAQNRDSIPDLKIKEPPVSYPNYYRSEPQYPGGVEKLFNYIDSAVVYPKHAFRHHISGRVILSFVIEVDGHIDQLIAYRSPDEELSKECVLALKDMIFIPAKFMDGRGVRTMYTIPINFDPEHPKDHRYHPPGNKLSPR